MEEELPNFFGVGLCGFEAVGGDVELMLGGPSWSLLLPSGQEFCFWLLLTVTSGLFEVSKVFCWV
jgi:hypothetical protein